METVSWRIKHIVFAVRRMMSKFWTELLYECGIETDAILPALAVDERAEPSGILNVVGSDGCFGVVSQVVIFEFFHSSSPTLYGVCSATGLQLQMVSWSKSAQLGS